MLKTKIITDEHTYYLELKILGEKIITINIKF